MDFHHPRTRCSVPRVEWRNAVYEPRSSGRNVDHKFHLGRGLRAAFSGGACVDGGCPLHAYFECRADRAEPRSEHRTGTLRIREVFREEVACGSGAPPRSDGAKPRPHTTRKSRTTAVERAARSTAPAGLARRVDTSADG